MDTPDVASDVSCKFSERDFTFTLHGPYNVPASFRQLAEKLCRTFKIEHLALIGVLF